MLNKPKKSLGQNFLIDNNILNLIVNEARIKKSDHIIEIGPGTGNLTKKILHKQPKTFTVIEKDIDLSKKLKIFFKDKINVINSDFLKMKNQDINLDKKIIFGNLPYNVSSQILIKLIKSYNDYKYTKLILMFQKEVADRIIAKVNTKHYGRLSIISQLRLDINKIKDIPPNCFYPKPKVNSSILFFKPKKNFFDIRDLNNLEYITRTFFSFKRKMIKKPMRQIFSNDDVVSIKLGLKLNDRPQNLNPQNYYEICKQYEILNNK